MTLPFAGGNNPPISINDINNDVEDGYGLGAKLSFYRGMVYDNKNGGMGVFPASGPIRLSDFYGRRRVDPGLFNAPSVGGSSSLIVPLYRTITIRLVGAGGGGGGGGGGGDALCSGFSGTAGGAGGNTTFGATGAAWAFSATGGGGGGGGDGDGQGLEENGATGSSVGFPFGENGGAGGRGHDPLTKNGMNGGAGGGGEIKSLTLTNPLLGGTGPSPGASIEFFIGFGGVNGFKGGARQWNGSFCQDVSTSAADGSFGGDGQLRITWTGTK